MVTRRRVLQGVGALAMLAPFGEGLGSEQTMGAALVAQQEHAKPAGDDYVPVADPLVKQKLAQWADWKFGIILHWGIYSVLGIVESWTLCSEDWIKRPGGVGYVEWKQRYEQLRTKFDPVKFDPAQWAEAAPWWRVNWLMTVCVTASAVLPTLPEARPAAPPWPRW